MLKPGTGWLQMLEFDREGVGRPYSENNSIPKESALSKVCQEATRRSLTIQYTEILQKFMEMAKMGLDVASCQHCLETLGFMDIMVQSCYLPVGGWPEGSNFLSSDG